MKTTKVITKRQLKIEDVVNILIQWRDKMRELTKEAAKVCVDFIDQKAGNREHLYEKLKGCIAKRTLSMLEGIGRNYNDPRLFMFDADRFRSMVARLPIDEQKMLCDGQSVEYLSEDGTSLKVKPVDLDYKQAKQLFASDHIRNLREQKLYLDEEAKERQVKIKKSERKIVYGKGGVHLQEGNYTLKELTIIIAQLAK